MDGAHFEHSESSTSDSRSRSASVQVRPSQQRRGSAIVVATLQSRRRRSTTFSSGRPSPPAPHTQRRLRPSRAQRRESHQVIHRHFQAKRKTFANRALVGVTTVATNGASAEIKRLRALVRGEVVLLTMGLRESIAVSSLHAMAERLIGEEQYVDAARLLWIASICGSRRSLHPLADLLDGSVPSVAHHTMLRIALLGAAAELEATIELRSTCSAPQMTRRASRRASKQLLTAALDGRAFTTAVATAKSSHRPSRAATRALAALLRRSHALTPDAANTIGSSRAPDAATAAIVRAICSAVVDAERNSVAAGGVSKELAALQLDLVDSAVADAANWSSLGVKSTLPIDLCGLPRYTVLDFLTISETLPLWQKGSVCALCKLTFNRVERRHHCRNCGKSICKSHSRMSKRLEGGRRRPVNEIMKGKTKTRVCCTCYDRIRLPKGRTQLPRVVKECFPRI